MSWNNEQYKSVKVFFVKFVFTIAPFLFFGCLFISIIKLIATASSNINSPTQLSLLLTMVTLVVFWAMAWRVAGSFSDD